MKLSFFSALVFMVFICSCKKNNESNNDQGRITFNINHFVEQDDLIFDSIVYLNSAGHKYSVSKLQYFISGITLNNCNGNKLKINTVHYINARDSKTFTINPSEKINNGSYSSITLTIGLDSSINQSGLFTENPQVGMEWPNNGVQKGGYHYMKLEGKFDSLSMASSIKNYVIHTGPTKGSHYEVKTTVPASSFIMTNNDVEVNLIFNVNNWFTNPITYNWDNYMNMIMMDELAQSDLRKNGADVINIQSIK